MTPHKRSFFERLTGVVRFDDEDIAESELEDAQPEIQRDSEPAGEYQDHGRSTEQPREYEEAEDPYWSESPAPVEDAQLALDMYETASSLVIKTLVAGVSPDDLDITITRERVTIRGKRMVNDAIPSSNYYYQELYWGPFSRSIDLPQEIEVEEAEAVERHGLLELRLPKINKNIEAKVKVRMG